MSARWIGQKRNFGKPCDYKKLGKGKNVLGARPPRIPRITRISRLMKSVNVLKDGARATLQLA